MVTRRTLRQSAFVGPGLTVLGIGLQTMSSRLIVHSPPPTPGHIVGISIWYLITAIAFAFGFLAFADRYPGRSWVTKGLGYSAVILIAVWIGGFIGMAAIDFEGGWNLLSPGKVRYWWTALWDCLTFSLGGLVLGLVARKDGEPAPAPAPRGSGLAVRLAAAVLLPSMTTGVFFLATLALPSGYDLTDGRGAIFYVFLFAPLALSGIGNALLHNTLRQGPRGRIIAVAGGIALLLFFLYWVTNSVFAVFFGFTWQVLLDFLLAVGLSLFATMMILEAIARAQIKKGDHND
jgi:hypothetical protein